VHSAAPAAPPHGPKPPQSCLASSPKPARARQVCLQRPHRPAVALDEHGLLGRAPAEQVAPRWPDRPLPGNRSELRSPPSNRPRSSAEQRLLTRVGRPASWTLPPGSPVQSVLPPPGVPRITRIPSHRNGPCSAAESQSLALRALIGSSCLGAELALERVAQPCVLGRSQSGSRRTRSPCAPAPAARLVKLSVLVKWAT